jgi:hypothetical protein
MAPALYRAGAQQATECGLLQRAADPEEKLPPLSTMVPVDADPFQWSQFDGGPPRSTSPEASNTDRSIVEMKEGRTQAFPSRPSEIAVVSITSMPEQRRLPGNSA